MPVSPYFLELVIVRGGVEVSRTELQNAFVEHRAMGGAVSAEFTIARTDGWAAPLDVQRGDVATFLAAGQVHFSGRVGPVTMSVSEGVQHVAAQGWWPVLSEVRLLGADPTEDHEFFGKDSADHPLLAKAFEIAEYLADALLPAASVSILPSLGLELRKGGADVFRSHAYSTKVGLDGFAVRQQDNLARLLEVLATMDDGWTGVTGDGRLYFMPRADMIGQTEAGTFTGSPLADLQVGEVNAAGLTLIDAELVDEAFPETEIAIAGRDASVNTRAIRVYSLTGGNPPGRRRAFYLPGLQKGQAARRFARGRFKRFGTAGRTLRRIRVNLGAAIAFEPYRGRLKARDEDGSTVLGEGVMGSVRVDYSDAITAEATIGELAQPDILSQDQALNPLVPDYQRQDDPIADVGDSSPIDFGDGQTVPGDGDDLHSNPLRDFQNVPLGGLDYGTDLADPADIPSGGGGGGGTTFTPVVIVSPDPPQRAETVLVSYNPAGRPLEGIDPVEIYWGYNAFAVVVGPESMNFNASTNRWEVTLAVPEAAVELDFIFRDPADPLVTFDDNSGLSWRFTTVANNPVNLTVPLPMHGHNPNLPNDGGDLFQNQAYP